MAKTDDFIDGLVRDLRPVRQGALRRLLMFALAPALVFSAALILIGHGLRPDIATAVSTAAFWAKSGYPFLLSLVCIGALQQVARPGGRPIRAWVPVALIYTLLVVLGLWQLQAASSPDQQRKMIIGISYWFCPLIILAASAPLMVAVFWFLRRAAPTHPRLAGFVAGMTAGSIGAWVYSWGCLETGLVFVAIWYTLGILLVGLIGTLLGSRLLRW